MAFYEDLVINEDGRTMCNLCDVIIEDDSKMIDLHLNSKNHTDSYRLRLMARNNIIGFQNQALCRICDENVLDLKLHTQSENHRQKITLINNIVEKDGAFVELPNNIDKLKAHCTICDRDIEFSLQFINEHINGSTHRRARSMAVQPYNGIFSVEGSNDDLWCKICQVYFENYIETIFEHVDEDKGHNIKLTKILRLIEGQNISIDVFLTNPTEDKATCNKCNTVVACNVDNLERHIKGKRHRT